MTIDNVGEHPRPAAFAQSAGYLVGAGIDRPNNEPFQNVGAGLDPLLNKKRGDEGGSRPAPTRGCPLCAPTLLSQFTKLKR